MKYAPTALLFARTFQDADDSAVLDWKWQRSDALRTEFTRPDCLQRVRFVVDMPGTLSGLRWGTEVYFGRNWTKRNDADQIKDLIAKEFFKERDPSLPPPRPRRSRADRDAAATSELRELLHRAQRG